MRMNRAKICGLFAVTVLCFSALSCNSAPDGFNAPFGAKVSLPEAVTVKTDTSVSYLIHVSVTGDVGMAGVFPPPGGCVGPGGRFDSAAQQHLRSVPLRWLHDLRLERG
jgi:hypothetical protein